MLCPELNNVSSVGRVDLDRYARLHSEGRKLITGWFKRAWNAREGQGEDCFEPFIFAWFAVNAWAVCVTNLNEDYRYIAALACNETLSKDFARHVDDETLPLKRYAEQFAAMWPIFEVRRMRLLNVTRQHSGNRKKVVQDYFDAGATHFQPQCWKRHTNDNEQVPLDWPHTLKAIYSVRCNLFHGEKAAHSEMDQQIVQAAFLTLVHFFEAAGYFER